MAVAANEPYQRVSRDNGVFDGALIGAAVGAGGAGAGVFGARMSYNGIGKRVDRDRAKLQRQATREEGAVNRAQKSYTKAQNAGPNVLEKRKYNRGSEAADQINARGSRQEEIINRNRVDSYNSLHNTASSSINELQADEASIRNQRNLDRGYQSPSVSMNDVSGSERVNSGREGYASYQNQLDDHYDGEIDKVRSRTAQNLQSNPDVQYRNKVDKRLADKVERKQNNLIDKSHQFANTQNTIKSMDDPGYVKKMQGNHVYSKHMGGWKNAAIIGASAVVGAGVGMIADGIHK